MLMRSIFDVLPNRSSGLPQGRDRLGYLTGLYYGAANDLRADHTDVAAVKVEKRIFVVSRARSVFADLRPDIERGYVGVLACEFLEIEVDFAFALIWNHRGCWTVHSWDANGFCRAHAVQAYEYGDIQGNDHLIVVAGQFSDGIGELFLPAFRSIAFPICSDDYGSKVLGLGERPLIKVIAGLCAIRANKAFCIMHRRARCKRDISDREMRGFSYSLQIPNVMRCV